MPKITGMENLKSAHQNAKHGKSKYKQVQWVDDHLDECLEALQKSLKDGTYQTSKYSIFTKIDKDKERLISSLPYYPDRITHWAIMLVIEDIMLKTMITQSCAALPKRGGHYALLLETRYLTEHPEETKYCLKLDVKKFFQNIDKDILLNILSRKFQDKELLKLLEELIYSYELSGIPIGNYVSQYFANIYLTYFDHYVKEVLHVKYYVRYMDDMVIFSNSKDELRALYERIDDYLRNNLELEIKSNYQIFPVDTRGVDFVGYRHFRSYVLLRNSTAKKFKKVTTNILKKGYVDDHDYASVNSYMGILNWCNSNRLRRKYLDPIKPMIVSYEKSHNITHKNKKGAKKNAVIQACKKYRRTCQINRDYSNFSVCTA